MIHRGLGRPVRKHAKEKPKGGTLSALAHNFREGPNFDGAPNTIPTAKPSAMSKERKDANSGELFLLFVGLQSSS